jgi:hypothetical protein
MATASNQPRKHPGSCHCGAVRFEVEVDASSGGACNCTICTKLGVITSLVKPPAFRLLSGEASLSFYEWAGKTAKRYFCKSCGISCFSRGNLPEVGGDYVSVSLNALDDVDPTGVKIGYWDGRHNNWDSGPRDTPWPMFG